MSSELVRAPTRAGSFFVPDFQPVDHVCHRPVSPPEFDGYLGGAFALVSQPHQSVDLVIRPFVVMVLFWLSHDAYIGILLWIYLQYQR